VPTEPSVAALRLSIDRPKHGWLPVQITINAVTVEFAASAVPANPIAELADAMFLAASGVKAISWWNLEPRAYALAIATTGSTTRLSVEHAQSFQGAQRVGVAAVAGSREQILRPIWQALRRFESFAVSPEDWPTANLKLGSLRALIGQRAEC